MSAQEIWLAFNRLKNWLVESFFNHPISGAALGLLLLWGSLPLLTAIAISAAEATLHFAMWLKSLWSKRL